MSISFKPPPPPGTSGPLLNEQTLWIAERDGRTAEGRIRVYRHGIEFRLIVFGELTFSQLRRKGEEVRELGFLSERAREHFRARGWTIT
jgi:hypothetical protein